jgi:TRAP-type C4-dicarboxylate transport system permease large subunit
VITVPIVAPLVAGYGYDLVWWGILMIVVVEIGVVTPPVGINVFVMKGVAPEVPLGTVFRGIVPFCAADILRLIVLAIFPGLILYLPMTMR